MLRNMMMQRRVWGSIRWVTSKRTTGGTEGKSSAQLQRPKTRSVAEGLLSRTRIPAKPLECSVVWDTDNLRQRIDEEPGIRSLVGMREQRQMSTCGSHRVVANPPKYSQ